MEDFDIEYFYDEYDLKLDFIDGFNYITIKAELYIQSEKVGSCSLHILNDDKLIESDDAVKTLFWFFDDFEAIASDNFSDLCKNNKYALKEMTEYRFAYLTNMIIKTEYRNKGIGTAFMGLIENMLRFMRIYRIFLVSAMHDDNDTPYRNESFYLRKGFKIINDSGDVHDGKMMYKYIA